MDIFKMATQIAGNMSMDDKESLENMDMEKMITNVTKNVFKMMNGAGGAGGGGDGGDPFGGLDLSSLFGGMKQTFTEVNEETQDDSEPVATTLYPKTRDLCFDLNVDLDDFYTGKKRKKLNVKRKKIVETDGKQEIIEEKIKLVIPIEKGMKDGQQIIFNGQADQIPGYTPGDIVITLIENEHPIFERDGDNLIIIKNINFYQLYDFTFDIVHLDQRVLRIHKDPADALHLGKSLRKVASEGMPKYKKTEFGDLFIRFNLVIPRAFEPQNLLKMKELFTDDDLTLENKLKDQFNNKCVLQNVSDSDLEDLEYTDSDYTQTDSDSSSETDSEDLESSSDLSDSVSGSDTESDSEPEPVVKRSSKRK